MKMKLIGIVEHIFFLFFLATTGKRRKVYSEIVEETTTTTHAPTQQCPSSFYSCEDDDENNACDPNIHSMTYDIGNGPEKVMTYVTPDVSTFYREEPNSRVMKTPTFNGFGIKVINMSPYAVSWWWFAGEDEEPMLMDNIEAFEADGTSSFDGHTFFFTPTDEPDHALIWFDIEDGQHLYYYDPFEPDESDDEEDEIDDISDLDEEELEMYNFQKQNLKFAAQYYEFTGRGWMSLFPRAVPKFKMWRADYFGQQHWVSTKETHFVDMPTDEELMLSSASALNDTEPRLLHSYRSKQQYMNMTMTVLSCAPRVFKIDNFLSDVEVQHIMNVATKSDLSRSTTGDGQEQDVRTSKNTWVDREESVIIDSIYRRAADLLLIDEALLRNREEHEIPDWPTSASIAESLQLVHYNPGEQYTPHHDAGTPSIHDSQQVDRFATLLLYLNEDMEGGETSFPRWLNAETSEALKVTPKRGQAVLFYNYLPDGNFDDLAQHSAQPVIDGEKWLINLWVWEPFNNL